MVMDLLGPSLWDKWNTCGQSMSQEMVSCIAVEALAILENFHRQGFVHGDIKPENLLMEASGYVRITDLGISREWTPENSTDTSGTPGYMAPEVMCR